MITLTDKNDSSENFFPVLFFLSFFNRKKPVSDWKLKFHTNLLIIRQRKRIIQYEFCILKIFSKKKLSEKAFLDKFEYIITVGDQKENAIFQILQILDESEANTSQANFLRPTLPEVFAADVNTQGAPGLLNIGWTNCSHELE